MLRDLAAQAWMIEKYPEDAYARERRSLNRIVQKIYFKNFNLIFLIIGVENGKVNHCRSWSKKESAALKAADKIKKDGSR